jgi:hypothetical protein
MQREGLKLGQISTCTPKLTAAHLAGMLVSPNQKKQDNVLMTDDDRGIQLQFLAYPTSCVRNAVQ